MLAASGPGGCRVRDGWGGGAPGGGGGRARGAELAAMRSPPPTGAAASGFRGAHLMKADEGDEVVIAVMYEDKDSYVAMVHDPATDENFGKIMKLLDGEPAW